MPSEPVFLDANILLEVILDRPAAPTARRVIKQHAGSSVISALSGHLVVHFGLARTDMAIMRAFLADYQILTLESADFDWAFTNARSQDFEDALQLAVAVRNGLSRFLTFDKNLFNHYKSLPVIKVELIKN